VCHSFRHIEQRLNGVSVVGMTVSDLVPVSMRYGPAA
jgi:hypothetical protein